MTRYYLTLLLALLMPGYTFAQDILEPVASKSAAVDPLAQLPQVGQSAEGKEFLLTKDNYFPYQNYLLQPFVDWMLNNKAIFRAWRGAEVDNNLSNSWQVGSATNEGTYKIDDKRNLAVNILSSRELAGFPFYPAETINQEADPRLRADKILWNMNLGFYVNHDLQLDLELSWFNDKSLLRKAKGFYYGLQPEYPKVISDAQERLIDNEVVMQRSLFKVTSPAAIYGYASVSERFWGSREDQYWIYSPVIERSRKVNAANRGDVLLSEPLTLDDFFVWSGKPQAFQGRVLEEKTVFAFYANSGKIKMQRESLAKDYFSYHTQTAAMALNLSEQTDKPDTTGAMTAHGIHRRYDGNNMFVLMNQDTQKYPGYLPWLPVSSYFIPRKVWIVELTPNDPFYQHSRQILFVDQRTMLPLYRFSYDVLGNLQKVIIGVWAMVADNEQQLGMPLPALVVVSNFDSTQVCTLNITSARTFAGDKNELVENLQKMLDITQHDKLATAQASGKSHTPAIAEPENEAGSAPATPTAPDGGDD
ncbi:MAG: DUF1329 domain-containing protein [Deltaproteobacteria bacterium]|nr:DUF1329 domain-containing protein [Deltaproteobacteria bacterium]